MPYSFFVDEEEIVNSLHSLLQKNADRGEEEVLKVVYQPQAVFQVGPPSSPP